MSERGWAVPIYGDGAIHAERLVTHKGYRIVAITSKENYYDGESVEVTFSPKGYVVDVKIRAERKCHVEKNGEAP